MEKVHFHKDILEKRNSRRIIIDYIKEQLNIFLSDAPSNYRIALVLTKEDWELIIKSLETLNNMQDDIKDIVNKTIEKKIEEIEAKEKTETNNKNTARYFLDHSILNEPSSLDSLRDLINASMSMTQCNLASTFNTQYNNLSNTFLPTMQPIINKKY